MNHALKTLPYCFFSKNKKEKNLTKLAFSKNLTASVPKWILFLKMEGNTLALISKWQLKACAVIKNKEPQRKKRKLTTRLWQGNHREKEIF